MSALVMGMAMAVGPGCGDDDGGFASVYDPEWPPGDTTTGVGSSGGPPGDTSDGPPPGSEGGSTAGVDTGPGSLDDTGTTGEPDDCPRVRVMVAPGESLNVRPTPSTAQDPIGSLPNNAIVDVVEQVQGEEIDGSTLWFHIVTDTLDGYVFGGFAACTLDEPPELMPPDGFWLPLECDFVATVSQGNDGNFSHQGNAFYAFDFALGVGTPMVAMADGIVIHTYADTMPGDPCYDGGGAECFPYANLVVLLRGVPLGLSGSTGYSTGRHAHVARQEDCGAPNCQSIPLEFVEAGVPVTGQSVTSENCP